MKQIDVLFDRMDAWRHFPSYQLERRADLFFSLYLPEVLEAKLGFSVADLLVPEFPARIGTIYPENPSNQSYKIDYVANGLQIVVRIEMMTGNHNWLVEETCQDNVCLPVGGGGDPR